MARILLIILTVGMCTSVAAQGMFTLSYGDVSADLEYANVDPSGWRINATFETLPSKQNVVHGLTIGYIETTADVTTAGQTTHYQLETIPLYYAPKMLLGKGAFKGFIKGALGLHFSDYQRSGALGWISANDTGFYGGASAGIMLMLGQKAFINAEYEWAYVSNTYYQDEELASAMVGLGFKF
jgi:hypothetical protein